jgi:hypothetical protein
MTTSMKCWSAKYCGSPGMYGAGGKTRGINDQAVAAGGKKASAIPTYVRGYEFCSENCNPILNKA